MKKKFFLNTASTFFQIEKSEKKISLQKFEFIRWNLKVRLDIY